MSETFSELSKFISDPSNNINQNESEVQHLLATLKKIAESPVNDVSLIVLTKVFFIKKLCDVIISLMDFAIN